MVIQRLEQKVRIENEKSSKIHLESGFDMRISNFEKIKLKMKLEYFDKNSLFEVKIFFKGL